MAVGEKEHAAHLAVGGDEVVHNDTGVLRDAPAEHTHPPPAATEPRRGSTR